MTISTELAPATDVALQPEARTQARQVDWFKRYYSRWSSRWPLAVIVLAAWLAYTALALARNSHLLTFGYDLGIYYEALRGYAHFGLPSVNLKGVHSDLLGDHFEPLLAILVPTYWIWPHPDVLLVDQTTLVSISIVPVWLFTERRFGAAAGVQRATTSCLVTTYALAWELQSLIGFDFHSVAFAVPIIAAGLERADAGRWRTASFWMVSLLLVKEDLSLVLAAFGIYAIIKNKRYLGLALFVLGAAAFSTLIDVVIPAFGTGLYTHWTYRELGNGPSSAIRYLLLHPLTAARIMFSPRQKLVLWACTFVPGAFLSLLSPIAILAVPELLERVFSTSQNLWSTNFQYSAPLAPIIGLAVTDGLFKAVQWQRARSAPQAETCAHAAKIDKNHAKSENKRQQRTGAVSTSDVGARLALALLAVAVILTMKFPLSEFLDGNFLLLRPDRSVPAVEAAERLIPKGSMVATADNLVPPLLNTDNPIVLTPDSVCGSWALVDTNVWLYPYSSPQQLQKQLQSMTTHGWVIVYRRYSVELLKHVEVYSGVGATVCRRTDPLLPPQ